MSEFFVRRPIVAIVIAILMTLIGGVCILGLPIAQYPQIAPPEIQVQTHYTGADALTIEQAVAAPIEQQMSGVDNMNYMYSINANSGDIRLIVNFDVATDPNIDHVLTQIRVSQAQSQLPADVINYGLTVKKSTTAPLMLIALYSPKGSYDGVFLANYAYINLVDQLTRVPGVGNVQVFACPSDKGSDKPPQFVQTGSSYGWNSLLNGQDADHLTVLTMELGVAHTPVMFDKEAFHSARGANKGVNYLYADGHIKNLLAIEGTLPP